MNNLDKIDSEKLEGLLSAEDEFIKYQLAIIKNCDLKIGGFNKKKRKTEDLLREASRRLELINQTILLKRGVPEEVGKLRAGILFIMGQANRTDITVDAVNNFRSQIEQQKLDLQKICNHPFVVGYSGYHGSYSYDHDDGYAGCRICLVCDFTEYAKRGYAADICSNAEKYEQLSESANRLIRFINKEDLRSRNYFWRPIEEIFEWFFNKRVLKMLNDAQQK
ncbi:MAG: hypothetical protein AAB784_00495 [Patescibacteria group bacterium]